MRYLSTLVLLMSLSANTMAAQTIADADSYNAVAYFTSGLVDGKPVDRIDIAYLGQDSIVLYVDWDKLRLRAYRTEVRIIDPNGQVVGILAGAEYWPVLHLLLLPAQPDGLSWQLDLSDVCRWSQCVRGTYSSPDWRMISAASPNRPQKPALKTVR